jgi:hypothetical protein
VGVHADLRGPRAGVRLEALHGGSAREVVQAGLYGLRAFGVESGRGFHGGPDDGDVAMDMRFRTDMNEDDELAAIGERLCLFRCGDGGPAIVIGVLAFKPAALRGGEEVLAVLRRPQHVDIQALSDGGGEGAAMGTAVAQSGLAATPIDFFARKPEVLNVHAVEEVGELLAAGTDGAAASGVVAKAIFMGNFNVRGLRQEEMRRDCLVTGN